MPLANSAQILCGGRDGAVYLWDIRKPTRPVQLLVRTARVPLEYRSSACMRAWARVSRVRSFEWARIRRSVPLRACCRVFTPALRCGRGPRSAAAALRRRLNMFARSIADSIAVHSAVFSAVHSVVHSAVFSAVQSSVQSTVQSTV